MDTRTLQFIQAVIGSDGARALAKAASQNADLEWALLPRVVMAWLGVVSHVEYDASLPGVEGTKLALTKSEQGLTGHINIGRDVYAFRDATLEHVAGSIAVALGVDPRLAPELRSPNFAKLGKSIDVLVKSRTLRRAKEELEKTSWNVKQRRRFQFEPGADRPTTNGDRDPGKYSPHWQKKPIPLTPEQVAARREQYARSVGLNPRQYSEGDFPNAGKTNNLLYDNTFDPAHEVGHAVMTPDEKTLGQYQGWLSEPQRANKPQEPNGQSTSYWPDGSKGQFDQDAYDSDLDQYSEDQQTYDEGAHHENVANATETYVDRRAGVDPHMFQSRFRAEPRGFDEGVMDDKSGDVVNNGGAPNGTWGGNKQAFHNESIRDAAKTNIDGFDQGKRFAPNGAVNYPTGVDASINARTADQQKPAGQRWRLPAKAGINERQANVEHNQRVARKAELKTSGGARGVKLPGQAAAPRAPQGPQGPMPTQEKTSRAQLANGAMGSAITLPGSKPKKTTIKVTKAEAATKCAACGGSQFKREHYTGCICFAAMAKSVKTTTTDGGYTLEFGSQWDVEAIATLAENLGK